MIAGGFARTIQIDRGKGHEHAIAVGRSALPNVQQGRSLGDTVPEMPADFVEDQRSDDVADEAPTQTNAPTRH
jgi:hypothetical protein